MRLGAASEGLPAADRLDEAAGLLMHVFGMDWDRVWDFDLVEFGAWSRRAASLLRRRGEGR